MKELTEVFISKKDRRSITPKDNNLLYTKYEYQRTLLLDISKDKQWIAYVTESFSKPSREGNKKCNLKTYLTVRYFYESQQPQMTPFSVSIEITDLDNFQGDTHLRFLSISPCGKRVALSSYMNEGNTWTSDPDTDTNYGCLIFGVDDDNIHLRKIVNQKGRAVFTVSNTDSSNTDSNLVIMNDTDVTVYNKEYLEDYSIQFDQDGNHGTECFFPITWSYSRVNPLKSGLFIINNTAFLQHNIMKFVTKGKDNLCSVENRFTTLSLPFTDSNLVSYVDDKGWCITFDNKLQKFKIIDTETGSKISILSTHAKRNFHNWLKVSDARLINNEKYLAMSGMGGSGQETYAWFEVWHIESGISIFYHKVDTNCFSVYQDTTSGSHHHYHFVWPFICEDPSSPESIGDVKNSFDDGESSSTSEDSTYSDFQFDDEKSFTISEESLFSGFPRNVKLIGVYTVYKRGHATTETIQIDLFQEQVIQNFNKTSFEQDTFLEQGEVKFPESEWQSLKKHLFKFAYHKCFKNEVYWLFLNTCMLQLWKIPSELVLDLVGDSGDDETSDSFIEKVSRSGKILFMASCRQYSGLHPVESTIKDASFIGNSDSAERLVLTVEKKPPRSDVCYVAEEFILPLSEPDLQQTEYILKNAIFALYCRRLDIDMLRSLAIDALKKMRSLSSMFFTTMSGWHTLCLLASREDLHDILYHILKDLQFPIHPFVFKSEFLHNPAQLPLLNDVLAALVYQKNTDLYNLLLNRIISSKDHNSSKSFHITRTLLYLQDNDQRELLLKTCKKLSFLNIEDTLEFECFGRETSNKISNLSTFSRQEQLYISKSVYSKRSKNGHVQSLQPQTNAYVPVGNYVSRLMKNVVSYWKQDYQRYRPSISKDFLRLCIIPLVHFSSYYIHPIHNDITQDRIRTGKPFEESLFIQTATKIDENNIFNEGDLIFEMMLKHKWEQFARSRFAIICVIYIVYYISYTVGVSFASKVFDYVPGFPITHGGQIFCLFLMFFSGSILLFQEIHECILSYSKIYYLLSPYNWIDLAAFILPILTLSKTLQGKPYVDELNSFTTLILWVQGILKARVWRFVGITLETIIQLVLEVKEILLIFFLIVCAFTNAFIILLMNKYDAYFQERYVGSGEMPNKNSVSTGNASANDVSSSNPFTDVFKAFSTLWFFIYGVWNPVNNDSENSRVIIVLCIVFSLITIFIFFNLVIVYMSGKIGEIRQRGEKAWTKHFASVVAEIEQLWCLPYEKRDRNAHPSYVYYFAHVNDIVRQERWLKDETQEIIQTLDRIYGTELTVDGNQDIRGRHGLGSVIFSFIRHISNNKEQGMH